MMDSRLAIYPTARKVEEELKRMSRDGGCVMGYRILTFPQLVDMLWRESDSPLRVIDTIGERIALAGGTGGGASESGRGLAACIGGLIRQLKSAAVSPADLRDAARPLAMLEREQVEMVAAAFATYEDLLHDRGLADAHDRERIVLEGLHNAERTGRRPRPLEGVTHLLVAEIYDLSLIQFMIVASLIRLIGDAELTVQAASHKVGANGFANLTWNRFVGEESIADQVLPHFVHRGGREGQLGFVLEHLFTDSYPAGPPADGTVAIVEAPDRLREVEEVARAIRRMLEADGVAASNECPRLERIGVIARDLAPYAGYLEAVFRRYQIPLRIEGAQNLRASAAGRIVMDLIKLPAGGYRRSALIAICNSPCFTTGIHNGEQRLLAAIGYIDQAAGTIANRFAAARSRAEAEGAEADDGVARELAIRHSQRLERGAAVFARLIARFESLEQPATMTEHVARLDRLLEKLRFDPTAAGDDGNSAGTALRETLDAITRASIAIAPDRIVGPAEFAALFEEALSQKMLAADPGDNGAVAAMPVLDARGLDFDCVFILGLNQGTFPRYHADDPIIFDELRPALNRTLASAWRRRFGAYAASAPGPILRTRHHHNAEDWFLFFLALSMPERRAVLSYAAADERGNPVARSPFVDEVAALCGGEDGPAMIRRIGGEEFIPRVGDCFSRGELINAAALAGLLDDPCAEAVAPQAERDSILRRAQIEQRRESYLSLPSREETEGNHADADKAALADHYDGQVQAGARLRRFLLQRGGAPQRWSSGRFNDLAACGFKFFAGRVLMLREEDDPTYEQSALETGDDVHRILHRLMALEPDFSDRAAALAAARAVLGEWRKLKEPVAREAAFFRMDWAKIERIVEEFVDYEIERRRVGEDAPAEIKTEHPLRFKLPDARPVAENERIDLEVEGYIDRLDIYRGAAGRISRIRVIDYKTSRNADIYNKLLDEENFARTDYQLALYVSGALQELAEELAPAVEVEAGYIVLRNVKKETTGQLTPELFAIDPAKRRQSIGSGLEPVADRMIDLAAGAIAGHFEVDPRQCDEYCPYRRVCRYNKVFA